MQKQSLPLPDHHPYALKARVDLQLLPAPLLPPYARTTSEVAGGIGQLWRAIPAVGVGGVAGAVPPATVVGQGTVKPRLARGPVVWGAELHSVVSHRVVCWTVGVQSIAW